MIKLFDLKEQYKKFGKIIDKKVISILSSGNYILGKNVELFEENAKKYLNGKYALSCNSGTDALVLSLRALGIKTGDEIITTPFSYFATAESISLVGAKPIFADINPHTFNINPKKIAKLVNRKTKAVLSITPDSVISAYRSFPSLVLSPTPANTEKPPCSVAIFLINS